MRNRWQQSHLRMAATAGFDHLTTEVNCSSLGGSSLFTVRDLKIYGSIDVTNKFESGTKKLPCLQCDQPMEATMKNHRICIYCMAENAIFDDFNLNDPHDFELIQKRIKRRNVDVRAQ